MWERGERELVCLVLLLYFCTVYSALYSANVQSLCNGAGCWAGCSGAVSGIGILHTAH